MDRESRKIISLLFLTTTASYMSRVNVSTAGPLIMQEFGLTQIQMGYIFSAFLFGYALFQIPAGMMADRWGPQKVLGFSAGLWFILSVLQTSVGWFLVDVTVYAALTAFIIFRFLLGIFSASTYPASGKGVARWIVPAWQGRANGIVIASIGAGSALTPLIVSNSMVIWGWRPALILSAIPALVVAMVWLILKIQPADAAAQQQDTGREPKKLLNRSFLLLTISYTLQGYVGYIFVSWFYLYLVQERQFGLLEGALMSSLPWMLSLISIPLGGVIADLLCKTRLGPAWGQRVVPMAGMTLSGLFIAIGAHTPNAIIAALTLSLATMFILAVESPFWTTMMGLAGHKSGQAGGIMNLGSNLGGLISPTLTPLLAAQIGWEFSLYVAAILALLGALLWLGISRNE